MYQSSLEVATPLNISTGYGENNDTFIIRFREEVAERALLQVNLKFISQLSSTLQGFYRVSYNDTDADTRK